MLAIHTSLYQQATRYMLTAKKSGEMAILPNRILNDKQHRDLLFNRCILEYQYYDDEENKQVWYDVHPLIKGIQEFKEAVATPERSP